MDDHYRTVRVTAAHKSLGARYPYWTLYGRTVTRWAAVVAGLWILGNWAGFW